MGIKYRHLSYADRGLIELGLRLQWSHGHIARLLTVHRCTVSREIRRGTHFALGRYTAEYGQLVADHNRKAAGFARRLLGTDTAHPAWVPVLRGLRAGWSPQQICGRQRLLDSLLCWHGPLRPTISHETIYKAIFNLPHSPMRKDITCLLRRSTGGRRRRRDQGRRRFVGIPNIVSIHQRPAEIELREQPGHWEGDLIKGAGGSSCLGVLVERVSRLVLLVPLRSAASADVARAFIARLGALPAHMRRSLTYDRGTEMARHDLITEQLGMPVYFCDAYRPGQRGTNENTNGLLRQYLPKGTDLSLLQPARIRALEWAMNQRPRKVLGFYTPQEVFQRLAAKGPPLAQAA